MRDGEDASSVIRAVKARIRDLAGTVPGTTFVPVYDRSALIERVTMTLTRALAEEMIVVALVIGLFLLHVRSALVAAVALPISVLLSFVVMRVFGVSSNVMSLGGIAIAIGAVVDGAIVIVEHAHKRLEEVAPGAPRDVRAIVTEAAVEVGPSIFYALAIVTVSFLPVFGLTGQAAKLFHPLAATKTSAMGIAAVLSVTLIPALVMLAVRGRIRPEGEHPISRVLIAAYRPFVHVALKNPRTTLLIGAFAVVSAVPLAMSMKSEFMPSLDEGDFLYMPTTFPGISVDEASRVLRVQDAALRAVPEVLSVYGKVGRAETATDPAPVEMVETIIRLKPRESFRSVPSVRFWSVMPMFTHGAFRALWPDTRKLEASEVARELQQAVALPGFVDAFTMPIRTRIDMLTTGIRTPVGIKIHGPDALRLDVIAQDVAMSLQEVRGTRSAIAERTSGGLIVDVIPRRDSILRHASDTESLMSTLESSIGGLRATTIVDGRQRTDVELRYARDRRDSIAEVKDIWVPIGEGAERHLARLGELADVVSTVGPSMIRSENGQLVAYVYVDVDESRDLDTYVNDVKRVLDGNRALPPGYHFEVAGDYERLRETRARFQFLVPITIVIIFALLMLHLGSVVEALIVFLSVPFAMVGSVWVLHLLDYRWSTAVVVGMLALLGLAAQTGVVMVLYLDRAYDKRKREGRIRNLDDIVAAHEEGTVLRVRPKVMTVITAMIGLTPLLWASGTGAEVMKRIAAPMIGGLLSSAFLTLELLPVVYTYWRYAQLKRETARGSAQ